MESVIIGRHTDKQHIADVHVDDEYVSNLHCKVFRDGRGSVWVEDLGSTNGTYVNAQRVYGQTLLMPGDRLRVGRTEVTIPWEVV